MARKDCGTRQVELIDHSFVVDVRTPTLPDPWTDERDRGRHRGWAWIDLGGEPDSVPSIRTMFKWTEITVEVSV